MIRSLVLEREQQKQRVEQENQTCPRSAETHRRTLPGEPTTPTRTGTLQKVYYGPRADRLATSGDVAQALLEFAEQLEAKPIAAEDVPSKTEDEYELRRVKRRKGRRHLANFENLPVRTQIFELGAQERVCDCCGVERKEIGAEESWQIEYVPGRIERIHHIRKKYACMGEKAGEEPQMEVAAKPEAAIEKGMAGPGLLAYIVTSKFSEYPISP
jgi:zinc-finger binding domain of transposase IS66